MNVERAGWMDAQASETMRETMTKEAKFIKEGFRRLEEAGKIPVTPPEEKMRLAAQAEEADKERTATGLYTKVPTALQALMDDPELVKTTELSKNLWGTCNPGYMLRDPKKMKSVAKEEFEYDPEELAYIKAHSGIGSEFRRRRDEGTSYMEAAAKLRNSTKASKS